jgi:hypothetical protein
MGRILSLSTAAIPRRLPVGRFPGYRAKIRSERKLPFILGGHRSEEE